MGTTASAPVLFVSHVAEDRGAAAEIVAELERRGVECWIAPRDVHPGQPFDDEIVAAIEACRAVLLVFSDACNDSEYIRREVTVAGESQKIIIPFRIEDAHPRRGLRVRLSDLHWIDGFVARERAIDQVAEQFAVPAVRRQQEPPARPRSQETERKRPGPARNWLDAASGEQNSAASAARRSEPHSVRWRPLLVSLAVLLVVLGGGWSAYTEYQARVAAQRDAAQEQQQRQAAAEAAARDAQERQAAAEKAAHDAQERQAAAAAAAHDAQERQAAAAAAAHNEQERQAAAAAAARNEQERQAAAETPAHNEQERQAAARFPPSKPEGPPATTPPGPVLPGTQLVASNVETAVATRSRWNTHDCSALPIPLTIEEPPKHGTVTVRDESVPIPLRAEVGSSPGNCAGRQVLGKRLYYRSEAGFKGPDQVIYKVSRPNGIVTHTTVDIDVR